MRVLVTGATGFVATHLVPVLASRGDTVHALGHHGTRLEHLARIDGVRTVVADLRVRDMATFLPGSIEAVVHLAQANVPFPDGAGDLWEVNAGSTARLLEWARRAGAHAFVLASTGSVYGTGDRPWREDDPTAGVGAYPATKVAAERILGAYAPYMATVALRLFAPYGPGQRARMVPGIVGRVRNGTPVSLREGGRPRVNPIYVDDLVGIIADATRLINDHVINVAGDEVLSIAEIASHAGRALGVAPVFEEAPGTTGGDTIGDVARMARVFGPGRAKTSFAEGVAHVVAEIAGAASA
jgi:nucleoside-diphosphate-sugar epimerase